MTTRMITGITVQINSTSVLWVVREGTGLARALNRTITATSRASTSITIPLIIHNRRLLNLMTSVMTGVADS